MNKYFSIAFIIAMLFSGCSNGQTNSENKTTLSAIEFADMIKELPTAPILDVRTPEEFKEGHLENAFNYDWKSHLFEKQIAGLDKSKPVFVYCLSGRRSAAAASKMREDGFKIVYELDGGITEWRAANFPETTDIQ